MYFGDGRGVDVDSDVYASMPALLGHVLSVMPSGGTIALTSAVAQRVGYPDRPENAKPGRGVRKPARKGQVAESRAVVEGRAHGWEISDRGIGAWTIWRAGTQSVAVVVLDWLDHKAMGVSSFPCLTSGHDPMAAAYILSRYRQLTGVSLVMTAGSSGVNMLRGRRGQGGRAPLLKWDGGRTPANDVRERMLVWDRPRELWTPEEVSAPYVVPWDTRAAYLAAQSTAELPYDALERTGVERGFEPHRSGYWQVAGPWTPYSLLPSLTGHHSGAVPLTTATVRLLIDEGMPEEMITDAWLAPIRHDSRGKEIAHTGRITRGVAERLRDGLAAIPEDCADPEETHVRAMIKATYREMTGMLERGTPFVRRPDWSDMIIGTSRSALLRKVISAGKSSGRWPLRIDSDCVYYAAQTPDHATENPGLPVDGRIGKMREDKKAMTMAEFLKSVESAEGDRA
ncbi:hypothetical protein [Micrococcus luteus]|uniref:hypothetical protein n=1 Tax=Micrococcus luteus TaxID=1270 RepID=UPI003323A7BD